jgi:hypothetical protein
VATNTVMALEALLGLALVAWHRRREHHGKNAPARGRMVEQPTPTP